MYCSSLDQANSNIKQQTVLMTRCLSQHKLMDAFKHCSNMLGELRNPLLSPKQYYELYVSIYDTLTTLQQYLIENHKSKHHLTDLYELVQYAGNIIPRLYLMITVGSAYLYIEDSPKLEICKDMIEMCNGVQQPIRGLFLRYYLSQRTKEFFEQGSINDDFSDKITKEQGGDKLEQEDEDIDKLFKIDFITTNFIEMNKLWVRLQFQGPLKEKHFRIKERKELQVLIGSNLVRLSAIMELEDIELYTELVLPRILEQVVQCRDIIAQEYLLEIILQIFPEEFQIKGLNKILECSLKLTPKTCISKVIILLIERLIMFKERSLEYVDHTLFNKFWKYLVTLDEERPDLPIKEFILIIDSLIKLILVWDSDSPYENIDSVFKFIYHKKDDYAVTEETTNMFKKLLVISNINSIEGVKDNLENDNTPSSSLSFSESLSSSNSETKNKKEEKKNKSKKSVIQRPLYYNLVTKCEYYTELLLSLSTDSLKLEILEIIFENIFNYEVKKAKQISNKQDLVQITRILTPTLFKNPELVSKTLHLIKNKDLQIQFDLLNYIHHWFISTDNTNLAYVMQSLIVEYWKLIRKFCENRDKFIKKINKNPQILGKNGDSSVVKNSDNIDKHEISKNTFVKQLFKTVGRCIQEIPNNELQFKLNCNTASLADQLNYKDISYDFFVNAFINYENLSNSTQQYESILYICQTLQKTRNLTFNEDLSDGKISNNNNSDQQNYYESLITKCTLYGSKLLNKQDQCRTVLQCSHLWWGTEISVLGEEEGVTANFFRDGKRVLECLQRSLRVADSIMDNFTSCLIMIEILNRVLYYFIYGETSYITIKYCNGLIELIKTNLQFLEREARVASNSNTDSLNDRHQASNSGLGMQREFSKNMPIDKSNQNTNGVFGEHGDQEVSFGIGLDGSIIKSHNALDSVKLSDLLYGELSEHARTRTSKTPQSLNDNTIPIQYFNRTLAYIKAQRSVDDRFKLIVI